MKRAAAFRRNSELERLLQTLNDALGGAEKAIADLPRRPRFPIVLVIGAPRSGTTLLMQWLAATGRFAYPSNLLSRFFAAPYLGALIQMLLTDPRYNYKDELAGIAPTGSFSSHIGKTRGALEPSEFWYFWRRFIPNQEPRWLTPEEESRIDGAGFRAGLAAIETAFGKPVAMKGIILQYNLACLQKVLGDIVFIHTVRDPLRNAHSLLKARTEYSGDEREWFSVKPREYDLLKDLEPPAQVAGQVHFTVRGIEQQLSTLDERHRLTLRYEEFCRDPAGHYQVLRAKLAESGFELPVDYSGPGSFQASEREQVDPDRRRKLEAALARFAQDG